MKEIIGVSGFKGINTIPFLNKVLVYCFSPLGIDERLNINFFNDYCLTVYEAELVSKLKPVFK